MNLFLQQVKRAGISLFVAILVATITVNITLAATINYIDEQSTNFGGYYITANPCGAGWTCQNSNAFSNYLGGPPAIAYGIWTPKFLTTALRPIVWKPYIPNNNSTINFGAVYYKVWDGRSGGETFSTPLNQTKWKGQWVNIGSIAKGSKSSTLTVDANATNCVPGYLCTGALKIYYDKVEIDW